MIGANVCFVENDVVLVFTAHATTHEPFHIKMCFRGTFYCSEIALSKLGRINGDLEEFLREIKIDSVWQSVGMRGCKVNMDGVARIISRWWEMLLVLIDPSFDCRFSFICGNIVNSDSRRCVRCNVSLPESIKVNMFSAQISHVIDSFWRVLTNIDC